MPQGTARLRLAVPDGREDLQHVSAGDLRDGNLSDPGENVGVQALQPVRRRFGIAPAGPLPLHHAPGGFGEGGNALGAALLRQGIPARACQLAVGQGLVPGLGQRDQGGAAESELALAAPDEEALNPAPGAAGLDEQVQPVAVTVPSRRSRAHEGSREGLLGMAAFGAWSYGKCGAD